MAELETISPYIAEKAKKKYAQLFKIPDEKIIEVLKMIEYGRLLPEIWTEHQEPEYGKRIARTCNIDLETANSVMSLIIDILRDTRKKDLISNRVSDLKKLGFKKTEIARYEKIVGLLKREKTHDALDKIDKWISLYDEVLPKLDSVECSFDIRCSVEKGEIDAFLPIVLIRLKLEGRGEETQKELVFQSDIGTVKLTIQALTKMYRKAVVLRKYALQAKGRAS